MWSRVFDDVFRLGFAALLASAAWAAGRQLRRERGRVGAACMALAGAAGVALAFGAGSGVQAGAFVFVVVGGAAVVGATG